MNWEAVGAVGEWVGGIATIGTLFYLAYQVRQNTLSTRSSAYQAASQSISEWTNQIASDTKLMQSFSDALNDPTSIDDALRAQLSMQLNGLFRNYENIFYQWREGAIGDDVWKGWKTQILSVYWTPLAQLWWPNWRNFCHEDFSSFLESSEPSELITVGLMPTYAENSDTDDA